MVDDKFGFRMIYPSKKNGQQWYLGDDAEDDDRFDTRGDSQSGNAKDGFCTGESDFRYHILTTKGYKSPGTKDHDEWIDRGYISYPEDWRNFEVGGEFKYDGGDDWSLYGRAGQHTGSGNCEGTKYSVAFNPDGETRWSKETYHNEGYDQTDWKGMGIGDTDNEWMRVKLIVYDIPKAGGGATDHVMLELWADADKNNSWKKIQSKEDTGENWGQGGRKCGTSEQATFQWGGPYVTLRGDSTNKLCYRKMSCREIDVGGSFEPGGGGGQIPGTPIPGEEPPTNPPGSPPEVEPGSVGKDKFGISQLLPTPSGGFQWFADFKSQTVSNADVAADPPWFKLNNDPYFHIEDTAGQRATIGSDVLTLTCSEEKDYRIEIFDETDAKRWVNIEATVYYNWDNIDYNDPDQGGKDGIRIGSDHHFPVTACAYNAHEYIAEIRRDGKIYFNREIVHGTGGGIRPNPDWDKAGSEIWWNDFANNAKPPLDTWIGFKFIKQLIDAGQNVRLQLYRDITGGVNGGDWQKLMEWKHIHGNWTSDVPETEAKVQELIDKSHENINDCRIPPTSDDTDPVHNHSGGMCHLRGDKASSIKFKWLSFREVIDADMPLPNEGVGCAPGYRKNSQGVCVPMDGSGGAGGFGEAGIVYKDFIFVYHIGSTDADTCNIEGLFSTSGVDMAYEVQSGDISYDLHTGFKTNAGIYIASEASRLARIVPKRIVVVMSKFGLPTGPIIIHATNSLGKFQFEFGRIQAELLTTTMEEYQFDILENKIAMQWGWTIWISYNGGDPQNFVRISVKTGDEFDGQNTIAVRYSGGTGRETMPNDDIAGIVYR